MKKRFLVEEDYDDLDDFRKILLLNKKKLDYNDVEFYNKNEKSFDNTIELTNEGILFHFDDLEQFLMFFFQETYEEGSDGEWDARNYDSMYYGSYSFYDECDDRSRDDFVEGYSFGYMCDTAMRKLKKLIEIIDPKFSKQFIENNGIIRIDHMGDKIAQLLITVFGRDIEYEISDIICEGKDRASTEGATNLIKETFCHGLKPFGIINYSGRLEKCFSTYFISWGNLVQMYIDKGEFDEPILDLMFSNIEKNFKNHPPVAYEIEDYVFDNKKFQDYSCDKFENLIDGYIEKAYEEFSPDYLKTLKKINSLDLFNLKTIPNTNYQVIAKSINPETLKISYEISEKGRSWERQSGISDLNSFIAIATQPGLFSPMDFRIDPRQLKKIN